MNIIAYDENLNSVGVIDAFESLIWTDRYYESGEFELYTAMSIDLLTVLGTARYLSIKDSEHLMVVESIEIKSDVQNGSKLIVTGHSIETILGYRIVWNQTILSGNLQDCFNTLITESILNPVIPERKIDRVSFLASTDPEITELVLDPVELHGENLYDVISGLCQAYGIGFKITLTDDSLFQFQLYIGTDRSYQQIDNPYVVFSPEFDNLNNSDYRVNNTNFRNVALVAGEGEGSDRKTAIAENSELTGINRREMFTDARNISSTTEDGVLTPEEYSALLVQRGYEVLSDNTVQTSFTGQFNTAGLFRFGDAFFMGDVVQIENEYGIKAVSRIIEIMFIEDNSGKFVYPTFSALEL